MIKVKYIQIGPHPLGSDRMRATVSIFDRVNPDRHFSIICTAIKPKQ